MCCGCRGARSVWRSDPTSATPSCDGLIDMTADFPGLSTLLRRTLEQTLIPSPNVVELAPSKGSGFVNRLAPGHDDVAETFHMNSRLSRQRPDIRLSAEERAAVRQWYFTTCGKYRDEDLVRDDP